MYYTPQYIADYIVRNTVGKLVKGMTPEEIAEITILKLACGSRSQMEPCPRQLHLFPVPDPATTTAGINTSAGSTKSRSRV